MAPNCLKMLIYSLKNTKSSYHMIDLLILNNFASGTNVVNKAVN